MGDAVYRGVGGVAVAAVVRERHVDARVGGGRGGGAAAVVESGTGFVPVPVYPRDAGGLPVEL